MTFNSNVSTSLVKTNPKEIEKLKEKDLKEEDKPVKPQ
jgi:hypothetical protein